MSTPLSEDKFPLLGSRAPDSVGPPSNHYVLHSERAEWERRSAAAADAATELATAFRLLLKISRSNYFGECVEGQRFATSLELAVSTLAEQWRLQAATAADISAQCQRAADSIEGVDNWSAKTLEA